MHFKGKSACIVFKPTSIALCEIALLSYATSCQRNDSVKWIKLPMPQKCLVFLVKCNLSTKWLSHFWNDDFFTSFIFLSINFAFDLHIFIFVCWKIKFIHSLCNDIKHALLQVYFKLHIFDWCQVDIFNSEILKMGWVLLMGNQIQTWVYCFETHAVFAIFSFKKIVT